MIGLCEIGRSEEVIVMRLSVRSIKLLIALLEVTDSIGKLTAEVRSCGAVAHSPLVSPSPLMGCQRTSPAPLHPVLLTTRSLL